MKTNFLNTLKQRLFLLIAVLGTFAGFSQSKQNPSIGGSKTPGGTGVLLDVGGGKSSDGGIGQIVQISNLKTKIECTSSNLVDMGESEKQASDCNGQVAILDQIPNIAIKDQNSDGGINAGLQFLDNGRYNVGSGSAAIANDFEQEDSPLTIGRKNPGAGLLEKSNFEVGDGESGIGLLTSYEIGGKGTGSGDTGLIVNLS